MDFSLEATEMDQTAALIKEMYDPSVQKCMCTCGKEYKVIGFFKRHLTKEHNWVFDVPTRQSPKSESKDKTDRIASYRASFMKNALLLRDTYNAYRMGDGDRILRNSKFEMLSAAVRRHTKYKLWLWRFQAYISVTKTVRGIPVELHCKY